MNLKSANLARQRGRRKGIASAYVIVLLTIIILPVTSYCLDISWLYTKKAKAQSAADAAALAGAWQHAHFNSAQANQWAKYYAGRPENGGYLEAGDGVTNPATITIEYPAGELGVTPYVTQPNWYRVTIVRSEPTFFARVFGISTVPVRASATALYSTEAEFNIKGRGSYGVAPGPVNLSLFGPAGYYDFGDCYSTTKINNGAANPLNAGWKGYDFTVDPGTAFKNNDRVYFQLFDPDCYNKGTGSSTVNASVNNRIDEFRTPGGGNSTFEEMAAHATTTKYSLWYDMGTPDTSDDEPLAGTKTNPTSQGSYGYNSANDMIWNDLYSIRKRDIATNKGKIRLNVLSTAGSSENGFDLRVNNSPAPSREIQEDNDDDNDSIEDKNDNDDDNDGILDSVDTDSPDPDNDGDRTFNTNNGSTIKAKGHLPINFNESGPVTIVLGTIPIQAAGGQLEISKFDTDVGATEITYSCSTLTAAQNAALPKGVLTANGAIVKDTLNIPTSYTTEGIWTATYRAGLGDTSVWNMEYSNSGPGTPGGVRLIR